ncbi:MAG: NAD(P)H-dependent oxidoreductase, partial [Xanthomonadales bacterium]|nr:NAD(P)H-dependent oxidoreductase [Xanthomonadales bacterium]
LSARLYTGERLMVSGASSVFSEEGALIDKPVRERLEQFIQGFMGFCEI